MFASINCKKAARTWDNSQYVHPEKKQQQTLISLRRCAGLSKLILVTLGQDRDQRSWNGLLKFFYVHDLIHTSDNIYIFASIYTV